MQLSGKLYGHIRISEPLGEGGMGTVYAGFDETLRRRVALKVLQPDQLLDAESRARLVREARSLSTLDHPNICRIHEYIEGADVDLLVLEYIEGKTLTEAGPALGRAEKLRVAASIAEVLVVAHRKGIVHRDLKPDNVMLTATGQVKVLDFGLARWLEDRAHTPQPSPRLRVARPDENVPSGDTLELLEASLSADLDRSGSIKLRTAAGITVGTPIYMSPEQARGTALTPASDMYSFGLLLQTLFTNREPYADDLTAREVMLKAARGDSRPVTGTDRDITSLILALKSIAPTDRPTAAEALRRLSDIAGKPKRMARQAAAAVLVLMSLGGAGKYTFDLRRERAAAVAAEQRAVAAQQEAATRRGQAEDLIGFMLGDLRRKLEPVGKLDLLDEVGERALRYSGSLQPERMTPAELARNAKALTQLGEVRIAQGRLAEAIPIFGRARELATIAARKDPRSQDVQLALMAAFYGEGEAAHRSGDVRAALHHNQRYLATAKRLTVLSPRNEEYRKELAYAHANVGTYLMREARYAEARPHFEEALQIKRERLARDPLNVDWQADIANTINKVGVNLLRSGDLAGARRQFEEQKRINAMLVGIAPDHAQWRERLAISHAFLASALISMGELEAAAEECAAQLRIEHALAEIDPANAAWRRNRAMATARLAMLHGWSGSAAESDRAFQTATALLGDVMRLDPRRGSYRGDLAATHARGAMTRLQQGRIARARQEWQRAEALVADAPAADAAARQNAIEVLVTGAAIAAAEGATGDALWQRAEALLSAPPFALSTDPEIVALRARLLVSSGRRTEARPLIARLRATGYHQPHYEWTVREE
ncbi:MAG TPA: serine/threonine-protein kinase [Thermoanaerobaculia bacterium]|nr:serine/threonine-protein kinase [Thermoanaerobaculia bacterium]